MRGVRNDQCARYYLFRPISHFTCVLPLLGIPVQLDSLTENTSCTYAIFGRSGAASRQRETRSTSPPTSTRDNPADSFGFVVLARCSHSNCHGSLHRWRVPVAGGTPVRRVLPAWWPSWAPCGSGGYKSSSSSASKYSTVGSSSATPIAASAYGTAVFLLVCRTGQKAGSTGSAYPGI